MPDRASHDGMPQAMTRIEGMSREFGNDMK
jgi:hypothetical protein